MKNRKNQSKIKSINKQAILHLSLIEGVGPATIKKILSKLKLSNIQEIYNFSHKDFLELKISPKTARNLPIKLKNFEQLDKELELISRNKINWCTVFDDDFPYLLKNIQYPPTVIYWQGNPLATLKNCLSVVGSRKAGNYCKKVAKFLLPPLIKHNFTIVSGGAIGADTIAHKIALENEGKTISIIGSGLLNPYPKQNKKLFESIIEKQGSVASPFPLLFPPQPQNFPARNRIISGCSTGCLILQASQKSGALITASFALEQGREVGAVPGNITDELSTGCNELISQGAHVITKTIDIFDMLRKQVPLEQVPLEQVPLEQANNKITAKKFTDNINKQISPEQVKKIKSLPIDPIIELCEKPISFDELLEKTNLCQEKLNSKLFKLRLSGKITQNPIGLWKTSR